MQNLRTALNTPAPAVILAEGEFGRTGGKTANGIVLHSEIFDARAVVDSETAGESPADVLGRQDAPDIPIVASVSEALEIASEAEVLAIGAATAGGTLPDSWVTDIETAIKAGCDVVSGLHIFLSEDEYWKELAEKHNVQLLDVRKPPAEDDMRVSDGSVDDIDADIVLMLGTDCAVGKRTTTVELYQAAREAGIDVGWVATGQTGIMVGAQAGTVVDRIPSDFTAGVVEDMVKEVGADHDLVLVEGQGSLTHRAYSGVTLSILHGAWPDAVVLADDPDREKRTHFEMFDIAGISKEIRLIEELSDADVIGISTWGDPEAESSTREIPVVNVFTDSGSGDLLSVVQNYFDSLEASNTLSETTATNE
ncbi:MAG: DUF1611 domain-containing protein [Halobacteriaceae archaeon]